MTSNTVHESLTQKYINEYLSLTHKKYVPFQNRITVDYYSLIIAQSNYDPHLQTFYNDEFDKEYGGVFHLVIDFPVLTSTSSALETVADEKGTSMDASTSLQLMVDPLQGVTPKVGDMIGLNVPDIIPLIYIVTNVDMSTPHVVPYHRLSIALSSEILKDGMMQKVRAVSAFLPAYHGIYDKELCVMLLTIKNTLAKAVSLFNALYDPTVDYRELYHDVNHDIIFPEIDHRFYSLVLRNIQHFDRQQYIPSGAALDERLFTFDNTILDCFCDPIKYATLSFSSSTNTMVDYNTIREVIHPESHQYEAFGGSTNSFLQLVYPEVTALDHTEHMTWFLSAVRKLDPAYSKPFTYAQRLDNLMTRWLNIYYNESYAMNVKNALVSDFESIDCNNAFECLVVAAQCCYLLNHLTASHQTIV